MCCNKNRFHAAVVVLIGMIVTVIPAAADVIHSGGTITGHATWYAAQNNHIVTGTVSIADGASLTIEPGCVVKIEHGISLYVYGGLNALGTPGNEVLFTRNDPEDQWAGLRFQEDSGGTLTYCTIEYATRYDAPAIRCGGSLPTIEHCTLRNNGYGIYFTGVVAPTLSVNNTISDNNVAGICFRECDHPSVSNQTITGHDSSYGALYMQLTGSFHIGAGNSITGNSWGLSIDMGSYPDHASAGNIPMAGNTNDDGLQVYGGTSNTDAYWYDVGADFIVTNTASVAASYELTVSPGVTARFEHGIAPYIYGTLDARGTVGDGILFTRRHVDDQWSGIHFQEGSDGSLEYCAVEHATRYDAAAVRCGGSSPTIEHCTLRNNGYGIYYTDVVAPTLSVSNTISDNNVAGICFRACDHPSVSNQTITGHDSSFGALYMQVTGAFHIGTGNSITGNNWGLSIDMGSYPDQASAGNIPMAGNTNDDGLQVYGGTSNTDAYWYDVGADFIVTNTASVAASDELTVSPGVTARFEHGIAPYFYGTLDARGTVGDGILFTRRHVDDQWYGLRFQEGSDGSLEYCTVEYAQRYDAPAIRCGGSLPTIEHCTLRNNGYGIYITNVVAPTLSVNNTISDNNVAGICFNDCDHPSVSNQTITGHDSSYGALYMQLTGSFHIGTGNSITGNSWGLSIDMGSYPDHASAGNIPMTGNTNDDGLQVYGGTSNINTYWYDVDADFIVTNTASVAASYELTVSPGVTARFEHGISPYIYGTLDAQGTVGDGILFTRRHVDDQWYGLRFQEGSDGSLEYCTVEYATRYDAPGVYANQVHQLDFFACEFHDNGDGVRASSCSPSFVNCSITDNTQYGIYLSGVCHPTFGSSLAEWNDIHDNGPGVSDRDLCNGTENIVANYVYWGAILESQVQDKVHHLPDDAALGRVFLNTWTNEAHATVYSASSPVDPGEIEIALPTVYELAQNYPNPFNPATTFSYALPQDAQVCLTVMDLAGRRVATLVDEAQAAGFKTLQWNASDLGSGVYLYRLEAGDFVQVRKMNLVK